MRKKRKYLANLDQLVDNQLIFRDPEVLRKQKDKWKKSFVNKFPLVLEIGMGTGSFMKQLIAYEQEMGIQNNYIGLEVKGVRVFKSYRKNIDTIEDGKLKLIEGKAQLLGDFFGTGEINTIYLNFSDPWPKAKHLLNRLTAPKFLETYKKILAEAGELVMKTDNRGLYEYSLETLPTAGFIITEQTDDLHGSNFLLKKFITEFESRFLAKGQPIYYLRAKLKIDKNL